MSLSNFKNLLATSKYWYNSLAIATLEHVESSRKDIWVYEELKRKQPDIYTQLLISEATENLNSELRVIRSVTMFTGITAVYTFTLDAFPTATAFALSSGFAFYASTLSSRTKSLIISAQLESVQNRLIEK